MKLLLPIFQKAIPALALFLPLTAMAQPGYELPKSTQKHGTARITASASLPEKADMYMWRNNTWEPLIKFEYDYDTQGRATEVKAVHFTTGQNVDRRVFTFDTYGNPLSSLSEDWVNGQWQLRHGSRSIYTYTTSGKVQEEVYEIYTNPGWEKNGRTIYQYNPAGLAAEIEYNTWDGNKWEPVSKTINTYVSGEIRTATFQLYNANGIWENNHRRTDMTWHTTNNEPMSFTVQAWDGSNWQNSAKSNYIYYPNGTYFILNQKYNNNAWENESRNYYYYDSHNNFIGNEGELWINGLWAFSFENKELLTYSGNNVIEHIHQTWDPGTGRAENRAKFVYSSFRQVTDVEEELPPAIEIYPNPATDKLTITTEKPATIEIFTVTGQLLQHESKAAGQASIALNNIAAGMYLVRVSTAGKVTNKRLIISN